jgi:hypothetical protein
MSDESKATWTDREIVQELFPATAEKLVPRPRRYRLEDDGDGAVRVLDVGGEIVARLSLVPASGNPTGELCCDLCQRTGTRRWLAVYRTEVPGSAGRRFRYLTACRERRGCEERRLDDEGLEPFLRGAS